MSLAVLRVEDVMPQPWKNGGGRTRELLAWPGPADWWLRISVADIEQDGPFSPYPGVERWFGVLEGDGVELRWPSTVRRRLHAGHSLLHFDGGEPPRCRLAGGTTRDLNVMHRRGQGRVVVHRAMSGSRVPGGHARFALFTLEPMTLLRRGEPALHTPAWSLVWGDCADDRVEAAGDPHAWWIAFDEAGAGP
jgi:hypothetical protein